MRKNIEATILSSFLVKEYYSDEGELFELDEEVFSCDAFKYVAKQVNKFVKAGQPLSLLYEKLDEALAGTTHQLDYEFILGRAYLGMSVVKRYYDDLVSTHRKVLMRGML